MGAWSEFVSALAALGCLAFSVLTLLGGRHKERDERINKIAVEVRHTQRHTNTPHFYDGDL